MQTTTTTTTTVTLNQFARQMRSEDPTIRGRAVENICSKWRFGIIDKSEIGTSSDILGSILHYIMLVVPEKSNPPVVDQCLQMLLELSTRHDAVRQLIREGAVQVLEDFKSRGKASQQPSLNAIISNLINLKSTPDETIYKEELSASTAAAAAAAEKEAKRRSDDLKLRLKDRVRHRRPATSDSFYSEYRALIGHANPELGLHGCKMLRNHMLYESKPTLWITEGSVLVELCDQLPVLSRRLSSAAVPVSNIDVDIVETGLSILSIVIDCSVKEGLPGTNSDPFPPVASSLGILIYLSLSNSVPYLDGHIRVHACELLTKSCVWLRSNSLSSLADVAQYLPLFVSNIQKCLTTILKVAENDEDDSESNICSPASVISLRALTALLEALLSHGRDELLNVFPTFSEVEEEIIKEYCDVSQGHGSLLAQRHPDIITRIERLSGRYELEAKQKPSNSLGILTNDAVVILGAIADSTSVQHCIDAVSSAVVLFISDQEAVKGALTATALSGVCRYLSIPPAGPSDCRVVVFVCRFLQRLLTLDSYLSESCLKVVSDTIERGLIPTFFGTQNTDITDNAHTSRYARENMESGPVILNLLSLLIRRLHSDGYSQRATAFIADSKLLYLVEKAFFSTASDIVDVTNTVRKQLLLSLLCSGCDVVKSCLCVLSGPTNTLEPEFLFDVQNLVVRCYAVLQSYSSLLHENSTPAYQIPLSTLSECVSVIVLGTSFLNRLSTNSCDEGSQPLLHGSLWCLREYWPEGYYSTLAVVVNSGMQRWSVKEEEHLSTLTSVIMKHPTAVTDAIALAIEGQFVGVACGFLSEVVKQLFSNDVTESTFAVHPPEVEATRSVLEESLFDQIFPLLATSTSPTDLSSILSLLNTILVCTRNTAFITPSRPDNNNYLSIWTSIINNSITLCSSTADPKDLIWVKELSLLVLTMTEMGDPKGDQLVLLCDFNVLITEFLLVGINGFRGPPVQSVRALSAQQVSDYQSIRWEIASNCIHTLTKICGSILTYKKLKLKLSADYVPLLFETCSEVMMASKEPLRVRMLPCVLIASLLKIDSTLWSGVLEERLDSKNLPFSLLDIIELSETATNIHRYQVDAAYDALGALLAHSNASKMVVFSSSETLNSWLTALETACVPNSSLQGSRVLSIIRLLQNLLHDMQHVQESEWVTRLGRILRKSVQVLLVSPHCGLSNTQTVILSGSVQAKGLLSQIWSILELSRSFLLCGSTYEHQQLFKDIAQIISATGAPASPTKIAKPQLPHSAAEPFSLVSLGCVSQSKMSPFSRQRDNVCTQLLSCLSCCGAEPKLIDTLPAKKRMQLIDLLLSVMWDLQPKGSDLSLLHHLVSTLANISRTNAIAEILISKQVVWDMLLGTPQRERLFPEEPLQTLHVVYNMAIRKASHKNMFCLDKRLPLLLLEILLSTNASPQWTKSLWLASSALWNLVYASEKNKHFLKQHIVPRMQQIILLIEKRQSEQPPNTNNLIYEVQRNMQAVSTLLGCE
eukprot:TRINITY_DN15010_c0_g3_i1.p1 TRINITY_DN15010_c0_g3~~TRINITY_DN15010_c0_g3_i1.p1  ORF type:complete len:1499 (+),score=249.35 TRINITY_DN15010_c0_g3_i1:76-4572(+)